MNFFKQIQQASATINNHINDHKILYGSLFCLMYLALETNALTLVTSEGTIELPGLKSESDQCLSDCFKFRVYEYLCRFTEGVTYTLDQKDGEFFSTIKTTTLEAGKNVFCIAARHFKSLMDTQSLTDCIEDSSFKVHM